MAVRTAYDAVDGTVATAANLDKYAGGWIGHNDQTAAQTSITTLADATGLSLTVTVGTSRKIRVSGYIQFTSTVTTDIATVQITDGSNNVLQSHSVMCNMGATAGHPCPVSVILNPSSGSNTWKLRVARNGSGTLNTSSSSTAPAYIVVEDLGSL